MLCQVSAFGRYGPHTVPVFCAFTNRSPCCPWQAPGELRFLGPSVAIGRYVPPCLN